MKVLAHRGVSSSARENTAAAFAAAVELGVDGFETDVRRTQDGVLVLYHDRHLPSGQEVSQVAYAEIRHNHPELQLFKLEEALARWPTLVWNLEVKDVAAMEPLCAFLRKSPPFAELLISSFDHATLERTTAPPSVHLGVLVAHRPFGSCKEPLGHWPPVPGLDTIVWSFEELDRNEVQRALARGIRSAVWGAQSVEEHRALRGLPLWGVITDHPEMMKK